ncbi:phospholipase A2 isoform X1 [Coccinella septempunctata]|uniref:phospholipase A2 isoform X1 n=2 Tax=Coccinella septempunctata TaxID=41139 RepID=UPI001D07E42D|nr:phospholipase A2 isoform X1 [Coccinella septempunctata]XP_044763121.1 phospholipase A2 isoform X1 [Coccinella septempunctata]
MHELLIWISLIASSALRGTDGSSVLIADNSMSNMIEITSRPPFCHIHKDRGVIRSKLLASDPRRVRQMTDDSITKLVAICNDKFVHSAHQGGFIYPGTKWCGPGNKADNYSDIGYHIKEDKCCREHDFCDKYLKPGDCERGICNKSPFTRSHCDCDSKFRRCLQNVNTETANTIGAIFFNVIQIICFRERTPCAAIHGRYDHDNRCPLRYSKSPKFPVDFRQFKPFSLLKHKKVPEFVNVIFRTLRIF